MTLEKILSDFRTRTFRSVYWLEGEEEYFIDLVVNQAETSILTAEEAGFNLSVFYGRDSNWRDIINACRKYPMFSDRQVVIVKEAQHLKEIEKLEPYIEKPLASTILVVAYKSKKVDGRTKFSKTLKDNTAFLSTKKLYDSDLPEWTNELVKSKNYTIAKKALLLLIDHIGNDLSRISNEIDKLTLNLEGTKEITIDDISTFVGISKEYNVFELQDAFAKRDFLKAIKILQYFEANPKAGPLAMILPSLYNYFSKVLMVQSSSNKESKALASSLGISPYFLKDYVQTASSFHPQELEKLFLLLHEYNLRSLGVNSVSVDDASILKELVVKFMAA